jgi:FlaA1/EpsC-like NDP-sugar epimerase
LPNVAFADDADRRTWPDALRPLALRYRRVATITATVAIIVASYLGAVGLRFDFDIPFDLEPILLHTVAVVAACKIVAFWSTGLFTGWWRHVSIRDVDGIVKGNLFGSLLFVCAMVFGHGLDGFPRSVFLIDLMLCTAATGGVRVALRLVRERHARPGRAAHRHVGPDRRAGTAGIRLSRTSRAGRPDRRRVGFLDDDGSKLGDRIAGTRVLGVIDDLPAVVARCDVNEVLIAIPSAPGATIRQHVDPSCADARVKHKVLPTLGELADGHVRFTQMREVKVDDLLARPPVRLDTSRLRSRLAGKTVLVTGAAGSIGSELCRQVAAQNPGRLVLVDRHENGMFHLTWRPRAIPGRRRRRPATSCYATIVHFPRSPADQVSCRLASWVGLLHRGDMASRASPRKNWTASRRAQRCERTWESPYFASSCPVSSTSPRSNMTSARWLMRA